MWKKTPYSCGLEVSAWTKDGRQWVSLKSSFWIIVRVDNGILFIAYVSSDALLQFATFFPHVRSAFVFPSHFSLDTLSLILNFLLIFDCFYPITLLTFTLPTSQLISRPDPSYSWRSLRLHLGIRDLRFDSRSVACFDDVECSRN